MIIEDGEAALKGYGDYAATVRRRAVPGLW